MASVRPYWTNPKAEGGGHRRYRATVQLPGGGQDRRAGFTSERAARRWATEREEQVRKGRGLAVDGRLRWPELVEQWWAEDPKVADMRRSTSARTRSVVTAYLLPDDPTSGPRRGRKRTGPKAPFVDWAVRDITRAQGRTWIAALTDAGLDPRTIKKLVETARRVLDWGIEEGIAPLADNPLARLRMSRKAATTHNDDDDPARFLTGEEVLRLAARIDPRYRALILVAGFEGLRLGELTGLRRGRVDLIRRRLSVVESGVEVGGELVFEPTLKSLSSRRTIGIARHVAAALDQHMAAYTEPGPDALVFTSPTGGPLRAGNFRSRVFRRAALAAGLDGEGVALLRPHDLRHTAISLWILNGMALEDAQKKAGHSSAAFTATRYYHQFEAAKDRGAEVMDSYLDEIMAAPSARVVPIRRVAR